MPFKDKQGAVIWEDPNRARVSTFMDSLKEKVEVDIPDAMKSQINSFMASTLHGAQRLAKSNEKFSKIFSNILRKGIRPVDIILPVYGNLQVVEPCIESILNRTQWPYHLTIVDDCSPDKKTQRYLDGLAVSSRTNRITVIKNKRNKGFAATVNKGIANTIHPYICVLNSDVLVTDNWLTKMVFALESDEKNKIVNPCTNNTALIEVPMQPGASYIDMNRALELTSARKYPEIMPTGFCFMFERDLMEEIGTFDEGFESYGEETDFWMRTLSHVVEGEFKQWKAVLADDTYLFHERGTSFSSLGAEKHMSKRQTGSSRFHSIWPQYKSWARGFDVNKVMAPLRADLPKHFLEPENAPYNVCFVVHSASFCGGMKFITDISNELLEREINVKIALIKREGEEGNLNVIGDLRTAPIIFKNNKDFISNFKEKVFEKGIVIPATCELVPYTKDICNRYKTLTSVLFAQSDDHELCDEPIKKKMLEGYGNVDHIISGSEWLDTKIRTVYKQKTLGWVRPGVDTNLFHPRGRELGDERPTVLFSLLDTYPYKGFHRGVLAAKELIKLAKKNKKQLRVMAYGTLSTPSCREIIGFGAVSQSHLAQLLGTEVDIFCDPSSIHSYGMGGIEAMASGVLPVMWDNGGIHEYADEKNSVIFPASAKPKALAVCMYKLLFETNEEFEKLKKNINVDQTRKKAVNDFINILEEGLDLRPTLRKINVITPHMRKHGGPTTIISIANELHKRGHDVELYTVYPDLSAEVAELCDIPIKVNWKSPRDCDVLITNSDNDKNEFFSKVESANKKIMLKLSHNSRFQTLEEAGLKYDWDHIITSTQWLTDVCKTVTPNWDYPPKEATRIGWWHYGHEQFSCLPENRRYGSISTKMRIAFLAHQHPLKGTEDCIKALHSIKQKYHDKVEIIAIGEWPNFAKIKPDWVGYLSSPTRDQLASAFKQIDIWISASHTEGLGRMALEAMSASVACCISDTGAEFAKDGENCLVHNIGNIRQLANNINKLIEDPKMLQQISKNGYHTAESYADSRVCIENLEKVIDNVCQ